MKKYLYSISAIVAALSLASFVVINSGISPGIDTNNLDLSVKATDDFYQFVNGNWVKKNPVPASEGNWGSFKELDEKNNGRLKMIMQEVIADKSAAPGSNLQKIRDFYVLAMDSVKLNKEGASPLQPEFSAIEKIASTDDLIKQVAHLHSIGVRTMFGAYIGQDDKASTTYITQFSQGGISLPDRDYYINTDERTLKIQKAYLEHVEKVFELMGDQPEVAKKNAQTVYNIETNFAKASKTKIELRNPQARYNKKSLEELKQLAPDMPWELYLNTVGIKGITHVIVGQPDFFVEVGKDIKAVPLADWKSYLRWNLINQTSDCLSDNFVNEHFQFFANTLYGVPTLKERRKRALIQLDGSLGEALGQLFVKKYFPEDSKKRVNVMIDNLVAAYRVRIASRDWMSEDTKKQANLKLDKVARKIGYPDKWKDYSTLQIKTDSYIANIFRANTFAYKEMIGHLGKPIDRTLWGMSPPTINAYYNPKLNEIVFPAGIMQPVFFNPDADDAVNYGSMGAVIGHELTHGFDDQGAQYDADGNLKNWWTKEDLERFKAKTDKLVKQFDNYIAIDDVHVKGALTLGENIADLGGLTIAYYAFKKSLEGKPVPAKIDGYTAEQRFFMAWAQGWRVNMRPEFLKNMIQTNPHSPGNFRANTAPSNMQEFYEAFGVKEGDKMYRAKEDRVEIW
jgi:putative endopeptidase